jgi:hypothetical protein
VICDALAHVIQTVAAAARGGLIGEWIVDLDQHHVAIALAAQNHLATFRSG